MREMYCSYRSLRILYSERGDYEMKKMKLQRVCCRLYPFILLDNKKERPRNFYGGRISMSLLYCVSSMFYFHIYLILLLRDPDF